MTKHNSTSHAVKLYGRYFKRQINLFYLALSFFTRIPVPNSMYYSSSLLNKSTRYFSLIGFLIACLLCVFFEFTSVIFSNNISIILLMILSILVTGAFHEDGITDMADGIGGGMTIEKRLTIMKDSRIGTYGSATLIMTLLLKYFSLIEIVQTQIMFPSLLLAYSLSRAFAGSLIYDMPYVADIDISKSKPLANKQSLFELSQLVIFGALPLLFFSLTTSLLIIIVLILFRIIFKRWLTSRVGGYTGDCLGAGQQISELIIYLTVIAACSFQQSPLSIFGKLL